MSDREITDAEFFAPGPAPKFSRVLKRSEIERARRRGESVPTGPPNWPPWGWESDEFPVDDSRDAVLEWFSFQEWSLQFNEGVALEVHEGVTLGAPQCGFGDVVRDSFRLVAHFERLGWSSRPLEPIQGSFQLHETLVRLRLVREAIEGWFQGTVSSGVTGSERVGQGDGAAKSSDESVVQDESEAVEEWIFAPSGTGYSIAGFGESGHVGKLKGFAQIARLIHTPKKSVLMVELVGTGNDERITADKRSRQPTFDCKAMRAIFKDHEKTKAELERAERDQDNVEAKRCREHIEKLEAELSTGMGIGGKSRDLNNLLNKFRPQIWGTLKTAIKKLREAAPSMNQLAEHFELSISAEGIGFVYIPPIDPPPVWSTEPKK